VTSQSTIEQCSHDSLSLWMYVVILVDDNLITEAFEITKKCD